VLPRAAAAAPPVYRPQPPESRTLQRALAPKNSTAPPVYKPDPPKLRSAIQPAMSRSFAPPQPAANRRAIQRCHHCADNTCIAGEKCGKDPTFGGLLDVQGQIHVGPYKDVKQFSSKGNVEAEHMFSNQMNQFMSKQTGEKFDYQEMPAYSIDYIVHQQGRYGVGGGISSTGSSKTSKDWSKSIAELAVKDPKAAARLLVLDALNAHIEQGRLNGDVMSAVLQVMNQVLDLWGVTLSTQDKGTILNEMIDYYFRKTK
jgi:hypothetical protein